MEIDGDGKATVELPSHIAPEAGIFTWDILNDLLFADGALASLFGLDQTEAAMGLPILVYLDRVHPDDRHVLSKAISATIVALIPQQETYRVRNSEDTYVQVIAYGHCFRDRSGTPLHYVGIVVPAGAAAAPGSKH